MDSTPTRRYGGSGLGLVISRRLCESMGGSMWAESAGINKGSTFTFTVRTAIQRAAPQVPSCSGGGNGGASAVLGGDPHAGVHDSGAEGGGLLRHPSLHRGELAGPASGYVERSPAMDARRVLLCEENATVGRVTRDVLSVWGAEVDMEATEDAALERLEPACAEHSEAAGGAGDDAKPAGDDGRRTPNGGGSQGGEMEADTPGGGYDVVILPANWVRLAERVDARRAVVVSWPGERAPPCKDGRPAAASLHRPLKQLKLHAVLSELLAEIARGGLRVKDVVEASEVPPAVGETIAANQAADQAATSPAKPAPAAAKAAPAAAGKAVAPPAAAAPEKPAQTVRILMVEDNFVNLKVGLGLLRKVGYPTVSVAHDGLEAVKLLQNEPKGAFAFDLVLMDLNMPNMGGIEAVQEIRRLWPGVIEMRPGDWATGQLRVIAVSADALESTKSECMLSGFAGWLPKPFRLGDLANIVRSQVGDRRSEEAGKAT